MLHTFINHIHDNFPFLKGKKLLLAVSGGIDSMVLMHLFNQTDYEFGIVHCNFQLRGKESDADALFVKSEANAMDKDFFSISFDTELYAQQNNLSIQLAARELRYNWFETIRKEESYDYILTAHHLDDQVETFLINLSRGTGLEGLTGIPSMNNVIIRPLLIFSRKEIEAFANENKILWREDSSNASEKYIRNKIRHQIVPVLKELNSNFLSSFLQTVKYLNEAKSLVDDASNMVYKEVVKEEEETVLIDIDKLTKYKNYKAYLYQWFHNYGFTAWEDIYLLVFAETGKFVVSKSHILLKNRKTLVLSKLQEENVKESYTIEKNQNSINIPLKIELCKVDNISNSNNNVIFVSENELKYPLVIRKVQEGDVFQPSGMKGSKKVSKFFKDEKYSLLDKKAQWLLCSNDKIVWIIGKRANQHFLANETTTNILKIELTP